MGFKKIDVEPKGDKATDAKGTKEKPEMAGKKEFPQFGRKKVAVGKSSGLSVWGVDHGMTVSKAFQSNKKETRTAGLIGATGGAPGAAIFGGVRAKKGRKAAVAARVGGRSFGEAVAGSAAGGIAGNKLGGGLGRIAGSAAGAAGGYAHGASAATRNAQRRGDLKPFGKK